MTPTPTGGHGTRLRLDELCDEHGAELFALACLVLRHRGAALGVVVRTLLEATNDGFAPRAPDRRQLASRAFVHCQQLRTRRGAPESPDDLPVRRPIGASGSDMMARLDLLSEQQRAAIALCLYGDHTHRQAAHVLSLPAPVVATLLRSGLHELTTASAWR